MNTPHEALTPEDRELQGALEALGGTQRAGTDDAAAKAPLRAALASFRRRLPEHDYIRALDPTGGAKRRMTAAVLLFDDVVALDAVGPYEVLSVLGGIDFRFVGKRRGPVRAARGGLGLVVEATLDEVPAADILVIPGGPGAEAMQRDEEVLDWVRRIHADASWTCSACTGALILGAAGVLEGRRATTHWASLDRLAGYGAIVLRERVVIEDGLVTGAGVSAGIDMGLVLAALLRGEDAAQIAQLHLEYDPQPPFHSGSPATAPAHITETVMARLRLRRHAAGNLGE